MAEKKLTRQESIVKEKKENKLRGVTTKPGLLQNKLRGNVKRQESIKIEKRQEKIKSKRGRLKAGGMAQKGLGRAFKKGGRV
jgi:hypothetical protein